MASRRNRFVGRNRKPVVPKTFEVERDRVLRHRARLPQGIALGHESRECRASNDIAAFFSRLEQNRVAVESGSD